MRTQGWYLFQVVTVIFLFSLNYLTDRLLRRLYPRYAGAPRGLFWSLAIVSILVYALARTAIFREVGTGSMLKYFMIGMVVWDVAIAGVLLSWPLCWVAARIVRREEADPSRRAFIGQALALGAAASFSGALGGVVAAQSSMIVTRKTLSFTDLPPALSGLRVVQISDSHLGLFVSLNKWDEILQLAQKEQPDVLLLTGDIIDELELLPPALAKLAALRSSIPCGIFACLGNHEYFRDVSVVRRAFAAAGIPLLSNENRRLVKGDGEYYLLAADYPVTRNANERGALCKEYTKLAAEGMPERRFSIFMAHHPDFITEGFHRGIPLTVAGHTHGAQFGWGERSLFEGSFSYTRGLYQQGSSYGFVSSGVGHWLPFRLNCPPEIVSFTLTQMREGSV